MKIKCMFNHWKEKAFSFMEMERDTKIVERDYGCGIVRTVYCKHCNKKIFEHFIKRG